MGKYKKGKSREQLVLFPVSLEEKIEEDNEIRVIDAFVESLDMEKIGINRSKPKGTGRPGYDPRDMLKIYLYGYRNKVRSSRKLMRLCETNIEMMWLVNQIVPDFRSISDFRKENVKELKQVFIEFNLVCKDLGLLDVRRISQDGTKIRAVNAKDKNYTLNKIDDRIKRIEEKIEIYLKEIEENDKKEKEEKLVDKNKMEKQREAYEEYKGKKEEEIKRLEKKKKEYEKYKKEMEEEGENQKSLTDKEARLMKNNGAFNVCYNVQTAVTMDNHLISNYEVNNNPADFGTMTKLVEEIEEYTKERVEVNVTDNGYSDRKDMMKCLEKGTIPEIYKGKIEEIEVVETKIRTLEKEEELAEIKEEEKRDKAMEEGIFIRDIKRNKVYCPGGNILREKAKHGNGKKYCNKLACKNCKNPYTTAEYKEAEFKEGQIVIIPNKKRKESKSKIKRRKTTKVEKEKKVRIKIKADREILKKRMSTSEHHHGNMKRWDDAGYLLLKGKEKVTGEVALYCCAYNIRKAINILGVREILEYFKNKEEEKGLQYAKNV